MNTGEPNTPTSDREVRAGIVVTGTELLTGVISDRNGPWLAERLGELGVEVAQILTVGDRPEDMESALRFLAGGGVDVILTSGGLGPTADDLTAEVVARFAGAPLELDEAMEATISAILAHFATRMHLDEQALRIANRKQAMVPRGATALDPVGTAPGLVVPVPAGPTVVVLPGPPRELQAMWPAATDVPELRRVLDRARPATTRKLRLFGVSESDLAQTLRGLGEEWDMSALEITTCLRRYELEIDIRYHLDDEPVAERLIAEIHEHHGRGLYSSDGSTIDEQLAGLLRGRRIGLAESCTAGLLAARLTEVAGSSEYVAGGVVSYSNEAKSELLDVPAELIERKGAVSPDVARAMADGALQRFHAEIAVGITGVAGPGGGTEAKPVGYVCLCVVTSDGAISSREVVLPGNRADIRDRSVVLAMHLLRELLAGA